MKDRRLTAPPPSIGSVRPDAGQVPRSAAPHPALFATASSVAAAAPPSLAARAPVTLAVDRGALPDGDGTAWSRRANPVPSPPAEVSELARSASLGGSNGTATV